MILSGDIGGTKTDLGLSTKDDPYNYVKQSNFQNESFTEFHQLLQEFVKDKDIEIIVLGIAGPVKGDVVQLTNLDWTINRHEIQEKYNCNVYLINDLAAAIHAIPHLDVDVVQKVIESSVQDSKNTVLTAVGTGLGVSKMTDQNGTLVFSSEGGHIGFSPKTEFQKQFFEYIQCSQDHVSYEMIVSSVGFSYLKSFLLETTYFDISSEFLSDLEQSHDISKLIKETAISETNDGIICQQIIKELSNALGAFMGDMTLIHLPANIYLTGGIGRNLVDTNSLKKGFLTKGRMSHVVEDVGISLITDPYLGLKGATSYALNLIS